MIWVRLAREVPTPARPPDRSSAAPPAPARDANITHARAADVLVGPQHGAEGVEARLRQAPDPSHAAHAAWSPLPAVS